MTAIQVIILPEMMAINQKTSQKGPPKKPETPENCRVYAIGDIHGCPGLLRRLHKQIIEDAKDIGDKKQICVYLGDYVDRGPDPFGVIDMLANKSLGGFERIFLKGNHEDFLISFLEDSADSAPNSAMWMLNGGRETLDSYGIGWSDLRPKIGDMEEIRLRLLEALPQSHRNFLSQLRLHHREGDYLFVHAGVRPGRLLEEQNEQDLMWIREDFLEWDGDWWGSSKTFVVHGHSIRSAPDIRRNRIGIDTGAWHTGRLTALVLDGAEQRFLQT